MAIFIGGKPVSEEELDTLGACDSTQLARAEARMLDLGHHAARRNGNLRRALAQPDSAGVWGSSKHRGAGRNWRYIDHAAATQRGRNSFITIRFRVYSAFIEGRVRIVV
ncbi:MAG TPA: hypothetical protein VHD38_03380 [Candidatus Paceibacterota bacterium]|nr:hypothetical protein [Candidatus Paceibacterota bacterium]